MSLGTPFFLLGVVGLKVLEAYFIAVTVHPSRPSNSQ